MRLVVGILLLLIAGCSSIPSQSNLSAEQITAFAKDKSISAICSRLPTPWGVSFVNVLSVDQSVLHNGKVSVDGACAITLEEAAKPLVVAPKQP
jgi:hypothetical protein